ncbi:MAG TPA: glycoside hydrolase family 88 protein [Streptosporangiales bacterium]
MLSDDAALGAVTDATLRCEFTIWGYGVGPALTGLLAASRAAGRADLAQRVLDLVMPALHRGPDPTDHLIPVEVLTALPGDVDVRPALDRFRTAILDACRPVPGRPRVHRPDMERWQRTIWVDCMHTDGPGLAALGDVEAGVAVTQEAAAALQRADGLFDHGYDVGTGEGNGVAWGRGQGWALLGLVGTLAHARDAELSGRLDALLAALARHERDGRWHTVVDDDAAPVEMSTSAYVALAVSDAVHGGLADPAHAAMAERAYAAARAALHDGVLPASDATPVGRAAEYHDRPSGLHPWGQGPLLLAMLNRRKDGS